MRNRFDRFDGALVLATYMVAALLVVIPLSDTATRVLPARFGDTAWRFGALGLTSRAVMTPLLGLLLAVAVAAVARHRWVLRTLAVLSGLGAILVAVSAAIFALDSLQMRGQVQAEALQNFDFSTVPALGKLLAAPVVLVPLGIGAWRSARAEGAKRRTTDRSEPRPPIALREK